MKAFRSGLVVLSLSCLVWAAPLWAQTMPAGPHRDPLTRLKNALQAAGASALTTDQQTQLQSQITAYKTARQGQAPSASLQADRSQLESAILAKDSAAAKAAADKIAADMAGNITSHLEDQANFAIQALSVLSGDQVTALQNHVGSAGVVRLLQSLAGGFNRPFAGGPMRGR